MPVFPALRGLPIVLVLVWLAGLQGCVPLPLRFASGSSGSVLDAASGGPVPGAIVVVRFEGYYDDVLPDAVPIAHRETVADARGQFVIPSVVAGGFTAWPWLQVRARVVAVWHEGYRCSSQAVSLGDEPARLSLAPAAGPAEERRSCRPIDAPEHQAPRYTAAWRRMHGGAELAAAAPAEAEPDLALTLDARRSLGFGANCRGPVVDLALAPGGHRAAIRVAETHGSVVRLVEPIDGVPRTARALTRPSGPAPGPLHWSNAQELVAAAPAASAGFGDLDSRVDVLWRETLPAAPAPDAAPEPESLHAEDAAWSGRSFETLQDLDPASGLPRDRLRVTGRDGSSHIVTLPGEACRGARSFGNPHYRMAADQDLALDVRFLDGGCHAIAIDLETGGWSHLVAAGSETQPAECRETRRIPRAQLEHAFRGYLHQLDELLIAAGADPASAFSLVVADDAAASLEVVDLGGILRSIPAPPFPIHTPLRRLEISTVSAPPGAAGIPSVESAPPLSELSPL